MSGARGSMFLAAGWTTNDVRRCLGKEDKQGLIDFLRQRHEERFFKPIRLLGAAKNNWQGHGFAMMSLCSLLVETIQSYRDGLPSTHGSELKDLSEFKGVPTDYQIQWPMKVSGGRTFRRFFHRYRNEMSGMSGSKFYKNIRNGLLHQAQTKRGWTLRIDGATLHSGKTINRNIFADRLERAFKSYLAELEAANADTRLWRNARRKIWWLIRLS